MSEQNYPKGVDAIWLASDRVGNVAAFITAGVGPTPVMALNSLSLAIIDVEQHVCEMPALSETTLIVKVKRPDSYLELASRGVFVYDWSDVSRVAKNSKSLYEPVAVPRKPIAVNELPLALSNLAAKLKFSSFAFSDLQEVDVRAFFECREAES